MPALGQEGAPATTGTIAGKVIDSSTSDPIIEAGIEVVGTGTKVRTDLDGKFKIRIAPGTYELRMFAPLYQGMRLQAVVVRPNQVARADAALAPQGQGGVEVVEVVAQADKAAEATQLIQRKQSAVVSDNVSAEAIKKSTDSNAAEVVTRVPAVTIKDNKYPVVRGLDERYTSALLNGSRLPSTDPERRVVPLDLFPAEFVESISLLKTYSPELPGDFSGGLFDIKLRDFPDKLSATVGVGVGGSTNATFKSFNTYHGAGAKDYFGLGADFRNLPADFPSNIREAPGAQRQALGRALRDIWDVEQKTAPPNFDAKFSIGNTWGPLGASLAGVYTTDYKVRDPWIEREFINAGTFDQPNIIQSTDFRFSVNRFETRLGGVLTSAYQPTADHKITLRALVTENSKDEVVVGQGTIEAQPNPRSTEQLQYKQEQLGFGQLAGQHRWPAVEVNWRTALAQTTQDVPDTRIVTRQIPDSGGPGGFTNDGSGGVRYFTTLSEPLTDSAVDVTIPFQPRLPFTDLTTGSTAKLKFGPAYAYRNRDFHLRRFRYRIQPQYFPTQPASAPAFDTLPTEQLLAPQNVGPFSPFDFKEESLPGDDFKGSQEIAGGYGMVDMPLLSGGHDASGGSNSLLRLVAGVRTEYSYISLETANTQGQPVTEVKNNLDPLPAINLILSPRSDMNVRVGYSQTVSRPEFRELSPVLYPSPRGLRPTIGNPDLVESQIRSVDLRWEWFFSPLELVSLSFFYKELDKPIEQVVISQSSNTADSWENADSATDIGFEFEGRKDFGFLSPWLRDLSLLANVAYVESSVSVPRRLGEVQTSTDRQLQGQSPYVVNAMLEYSYQEWLTRMLYQTQGSKIAEAGASGLPDISEEPRHQLDLVVQRKINPFGTPLTAKLGFKNILNDRFLFLQGDQVQRRYRTGVSIAFGVSYAY